MCRNIFFLIVLITFSLISVSCKENDKKNILIKKGVLDLRKHSFKENMPIVLNGEWIFFFDKHLSYKEIKTYENEKKLTYINAPSSWNDKPYNGRVLPSFGHATYVLKLNLNEEDVNELLALKILEIGHAYSLYVNDTFAGKDGIAGKLKEKTKESFVPKVIPFKSPTNEVYLIFHISNFKHRRAGIRDEIMLGRAYDVYKIRIAKIALELAVFGALLMVGIYYLIFFFLRKREKASLLFSLLAFVFALRTVFSNEAFANYIFDAITWRFSMQIEYLTVYIMPILISAYLKTLFPKEIPKVFVMINAVVSAFFIGATLISPAYFFTNLLIPFEITAGVLGIVILIFIITAILNKREGARTFTLSFSILFATFAIDALVAIDVIELWRISQFGFFAFIITQSQILTAKFANAFDSVENLSEERNELINTLESRVEERTLDLKSTLNKLERATKIKSDFLAQISHELRTPLNAILGFTNLLKTELKIKAKSEKEILFLDKIFFSATMLHTLIEDLLALSRTEQVQTELRYKYFNIAETIERASGMFYPKAENKKLEIDTDTNAAKGYDIYLDETRVRQVFINLLSNAIKFTQKGGVYITLRFIKENDYEGTLRLSVRDTGVGFSDEENKNIWNAFSRGKAGEITNESGLGLGLTITKRLAHAMNGKIESNSNVDEGSEFILIVENVLYKKTNKENKDSNEQLPYGGFLNKLNEEERISLKENLKYFFRDKNNESDFMALEKLSKTIEVSAGFNGNEDYIEFAKRFSAAVATSDIISIRKHINVLKNEFDID